MSKNTYFTGQLIYSQILSLVKKEKINQISREGHYDPLCEEVRRIYSLRDHALCSLMDTIPKSV